MKRKMLPKKKKRALKKTPIKQIKDVVLLSDLDFRIKQIKHNSIVLFGFILHFPCNISFLFSGLRENKAKASRKTARHTTSTWYHMSTVRSSLVKAPVIITSVVSLPSQHSSSHSGRDGALKAASLGLTDWSKICLTLTFTAHFPVSLLSFPIVLHCPSGASTEPEIPLCFTGPVCLSQLSRFS